VRALRGKKKGKKKSRLVRSSPTKYRIANRGKRNSFAGVYLFLLPATAGGRKGRKKKKKGGKVRRTEKDVPFSPVMHRPPRGEGRKKREKKGVPSCTVTRLLRQREGGGAHFFNRKRKREKGRRGKGEEGQHRYT